MQLGTDGVRGAQGSATWWAQLFPRSRTLGGMQRLLGRFAEIGDSGIRGEYPCGAGHAVPPGSTRALCGREVAHVWPAPFDPRSRIVDVCPTCAAAAAGSG